MSNKRREEEKKGIKSFKMTSFSNDKYSRWNLSAASAIHNPNELGKKVLLFPLKILTQLP